MSVAEYVDTNKRKESAPSLSRYFIGLRDGLFEFNAALESAGIRVFCPPAGKVIMEAEELRKRAEAVLREREANMPNFAEYAGQTTLGLVSLELLNQLYPCVEEQEEGAQGATLPPRTRQ